MSQENLSARDSVAHENGLDEEDSTEGAIRRSFFVQFVPFRKYCGARVKLGIRCIVV